MARTHERTSARRCAAQILYTGTIRDCSASDLLNSGGVDCIEGLVSDYALMLVNGVEERMDELDERLSSISKNWSVSRMPIMDLAILRIALYEMLYVEEVPLSVSINEAVEMAKFFGGDDDSPKFVNGMLGNVARQIEDAENASDDSVCADASDTSASIEDTSAEDVDGNELQGEQE